MAGCPCSFAPDEHPPLRLADARSTRGRQPTRPQSSEYGWAKGASGSADVPCVSPTAQAGTSALTAATAEPGHRTQGHLQQGALIRALGCAGPGGPDPYAPAKCESAAHAPRTAAVTRAISASSGESAAVVARMCASWETIPSVRRTEATDSTGGCGRPGRRASPSSSRLTGRRCRAGSWWCGPRR